MLADVIVHRATTCNVFFLLFFFAVEMHDIRNVDAILCIYTQVLRRCRIYG